MAVPKKRTSKSKVGMRRSHDFIKPVGVAICKNCGQPSVPHNICGFCNTYAGRNVKGTKSVVSTEKAE
ncbi:MAG: 50S ribosomal protein L32 [Holosporales bacterium]|jgi:large subunit ribosomal protein L32|nr:50S ribosomal protein L32 [Holosporales bacterium]